MPGRVSLDSNIVIALFAGDQEVVHEVESSGEVFVASIVLGVLYYGARNSARIEENLGRIDEFATTTSVLFVDADTAREYGKIKDQLRANGTPIPENDIWIAALCRQYGLSVVSRDRHFGLVDGIDLLIW
jgi:tRNA(fMet)-specific endonuclease VapC